MSREKLEEILNRCITETTGENSQSMSWENCLNAMKEAYNLGVTDSAESATAYIAKEGNSTGNWEYGKVNKQSILNLLIP